MLGAFFFPEISVLVVLVLALQWNFATNLTNQIKLMLISKQNVVLSIVTCSDLCGDSRGTLGILSVLQCTVSIESHLACSHLSRETITKGQHYLGEGRPLWFRWVDCHANVRMCSSTGTPYEEFWCPRAAYQYPALHGRPGRSQKGAKRRYSVNLEMAKAVCSNVWCSHSNRFRCVDVQYCNFLTHILLHNLGVETFHQQRSIK